MNLYWSLKELYQSFEDEQFKRDLKQVDNFIETMDQWSQTELTTHEHAISKLEEGINQSQALDHVFSKLYAFTVLTLSVDAKNNQAQQVLDSLQQKETKLTKSIVTFERWIGGLDNLSELIVSSDTLKEHHFFLSEIHDKNQYLLSDEEEILISKMKNTGSKAWSKLQELLTSTLLIEINVDGETKKLPLPVVRNMSHDSDVSVRKSAFEAELKAYGDIEESSAAALNGIKGEVFTLSELRGYDSPLAETLIQNRMESNVLDTMLEAMRESLPSFQRYYRRKAALLGHQGGLPFYDLLAPMGSVNKKFSYEEARDYIVTNFRSFSDELADFAHHAFESQWIDAEPRQGKRGGAFCFNLHPIKESRILANFTGTFSDVTTLAHELGHAYHGYCLKDESILNSNYPMPIAETASIFAESVVVNAALKEANDEEKLNLLEESISSAGQVIVDIYSRYLFETAVFEKRRDYSLSVKEFKELMVSAQKEAYGDGLDHRVLHPYMWVNKPHYYSGSRSFYNFPYAFGLLFAKGLYAEYLIQGDAFIPKYNELLTATGKLPIIDVGKMVGIDVTSIEFWRNSLKLVERDIEQFIALS
ncbi:oligoendopeptidase, pepF/M3 family [Alkaliphilus metalliredigens QYMF]|uniref:Oligoendopeptidase, pepF/M3 family n=1 Tax=Alkaliphilus metalliredigens (strain QYMF) TaxID=293826 RepID=A6TM57_ALKMQ|nr:M3 family oligoendopeptidase [Alkaliphilus metalliredigens]ABR47275.1 oligoendopeptidase, pepF/M3 family [Alkaliphilus metalliredigens QYMF]